MSHLYARWILSATSITCLIEIHSLSSLMPLLLRTTTHNGGDRWRKLRKVSRCTTFNITVVLSWNFWHSRKHTLSEPLLPGYKLPSAHTSFARQIWSCCLCSWAWLGPDHACGHFGRCFLLLLAALTAWLALAMRVSWDFFSSLLSNFLLVTFL